MMGAQALNPGTCERGIDVGQGTAQQTTAVRDAPNDAPTVQAVKEH